MFNFLELFKKNTKNQMNTKVEINVILITKLAFELKKLFLEKDIFYDLDIRQFRILKSNSKFTYTIENIIAEILKYPFIIVEDKQLMLSFFNDTNWHLIIETKLTSEEQEVYYTNKKFFINQAIYFLFKQSQFPFIVPNCKSNLFVEFNDKLISLSDVSYSLMSEIDLQNTKRKNLACLWYCKFNYDDTVFPTYLIHLLTTLSLTGNIYIFLHDFFVNFVEYYIGFLFHKKNLVEIQRQDIEKALVNITTVLKKELEEEYKSTGFFLSDGEIDKLISQFKQFLVIFFSNILGGIFINSSFSYDGKSKNEVGFNSKPHIITKEETKHINNFINFVEKIIKYSDISNCNTTELQSENIYPFLIIIIDILHKQDRQITLKFINHLKKNYLDGLLNLKKVLETRELVSVVDEYNNIFGKDEFIFFMVKSVESYIKLLIVSENFTVNLDIRYYKYILKYFKTD